MVMYVSSRCLMDFGMENHQSFNVPMPRKHNKNNDFHKISLFQLFPQFHGFGHHFQAHFGGFGVLQGTF